MSSSSKVLAVASCLVLVLACLWTDAEAGPAISGQAGAWNNQLNHGAHQGLARSALLANMRRSFIEQTASTIMSWLDTGLGRQARSAFGSIFGVTSDDAMKGLFVKILEWIAGLIGELVFSPLLN